VSIPILYEVRLSLSRTIQFSFIFLLFWGFVPISVVYCVELTTVRVANGLSAPLFAISPPGDSERLVIVEQNSAQIKILKNGSILPTPFIDLDSKAGSGGEQGLLGLAFHPDYPNNGFFFVDYTDNSGDTVIASYQVSADPDVADSNSELIISTIGQPAGNHNGGMLAFGPNDGYLYIGSGDGGGGGGFDPNNLAQNGQVLLGKILRIDIDNGNPLSIPQDNPFVGNALVDDAIWALGLRNPWRFSFDRLTGDLYTADVGEGSLEEVNWQSGNSSGGENYGWRCMEGTQCTGLTGCTCNSPGLTLPVHDYSHTGGNCSITGGYAYRGSAIPELQGTYFFADYCSARIWSFRWDGINITEFQERTAELAPGAGQTIDFITSFGEDASGELYIVDQGGEVFKVIPVNPFTLLPVTPGVANTNNVIQATGSTPGGKVAFAWGRQTGNFTLQNVCQGLSLDINRPRRVGTDFADPSGVATTNLFVPNRANGVTLVFQAIDLQTCTASNLVQETF